MTSSNVTDPVRGPVEQAHPAPCHCVPDVGSSAVPDCWLRSASDRDRLQHACALLRRHGITVLAALSSADPAATGTRIQAMVTARFPDADGAYVFWTQAEDERCLAADGTLLTPLMVHAAGPAVEVAVLAALAGVGLGAEPGPTPGTHLVGRT
ncbi:MAG: hypothetical protein ABI345_01245 [Jatrophihabitans sp.]